MAKTKKAYDQHYTTGLEDLVLNVNQVAAAEYPAHELYFVKYEGESLGPIWQEDLKSYLDANPTYVTKAQLVKADDYVQGSDENWEPLCDHPYFQRRRPQVVGQAQDLENFENLYVLKNGQKKGPYTLVELMNELRKKDILFTDHISFDKGHSWKKIHEIKDLDRRELKDEHLPERPATELFNALTSIRNLPESSVLTNLAMMGGIHQNKNEEPKTQESSSPKEEEEVSTAGSKTKTTYILFVTVFVVAVSAGSFLIPNKKKTGPSTNRTPVTNKESKTVKKDKPVRNKRPQSATNRSRTLSNDFERAKPVERQERVNPREGSRPPRRERKSFRESDSYKVDRRQEARERREQETEEEIRDGYEYDDGDKPVDQDPVRDQLDKETVDPEENYNDVERVDYEEDIYSEGEEFEEDVIDQDLDY